LFAAALNRQTRRPGPEVILGERVPEPVLWLIEYNDGLRASVLELNGAVSEWTGAWRYRSGRKIVSTQFWTQEARPAAHFTLRLQAAERMMFSGKPSWNVERTLMSSGLLDALLLSKLKSQTRRVTPYLQFGYQPMWRWQQPPPPPVGRPWGEQ